MTDNLGEVSFSTIKPNGLEALRRVRDEKPTDQKTLDEETEGNMVSAAQARERRTQAAMEANERLTSRRQVAAALICATHPPCSVYNGLRARELSTAMQQQVVNSAMDGVDQLIGGYGSYFDLDSLQTLFTNDPTLQQTLFHQDEKDPKSPLIPGLFRLAYQMRLRELFEALNDAEDTTQG